MKIGITATRQELTAHQRKWLKTIFVNRKPTVVIHGDCVGGDATAHDIAIDLGIKTEIYPPDISKLRAFKKGDKIHPVAPFLERNKRIVDACDHLLFLPSGFTEELRSGTWSTYRYAKKTKCPFKIIYP